VDDNGARSETIPGTATPITYSYGDLLSLELPPDRPLIAGVMGEETGNIWGGPGGVGKSWLLMEAARAIASGTPFLDHFPTEQHAVLVIDEENRLRTLVQRARMFERAAPLGPDLPITYASLQGLRVDAAAEAAQVDALMTKHTPGLTILDSFTRVHGANENNAGEMAAVFFNVKALMRAHRCAVLFSDHTRKRGLVNNDPGETLRGSSEKRAWPETILDVAADETERGTLVISMPKSRESEALVPFTVRLEVDNAAGTALLRYGGEATQTQAAKGGEIIGAVHAITAQLGADACDAATLAAYLTCSADTVRRHGTKLFTAGILTSRSVVPSAKGGKPKTVYAVAGGRE